MNAFRALWNSISNLTAAMNGLAVTVDAVSQEVQRRTGVSVDPLLIDHEPHDGLNGGTEPAALPAGRKRRVAP